MSITDWDKRLLCPDGSCVGVIGTDGTCKVCGSAAPNWGDDRRRGLKTTGELKGARGATVPAPEDEHLAAAAAAADAGDEDDGDDGDDDELAEDSGIDGDDDDVDDDDDDDADDDDDDDADGDDDEDDDEDEDGDESEGDEDPGSVQARAEVKTAIARDKRRAAKALAAAAAEKRRLAKGSTSPEWDRRELCSNGACIGVIGDDGKCKSCGTAA